MNSGTILGARYGRIYCTRYGSLLTNKVQNAGVVVGDFSKLGVGYFGYFTFAFGFDPSRSGI